MSDYSGKNIDVHIDRGRYDDKVGGRKFASLDEAVLFFNSIQIFFPLSISPQLILIVGVMYFCLHRFVFSFISVCYSP